MSTVRPALIPTIVLALLGSGCATRTPMATAPTASIPVATPLAVAGDWRKSVTEADRDRLRRWRTSFVLGLDGALAGGHRAEVEAEGALLKPDAALGQPTLPAGAYRCRTIKLGALSPGMPTFNPYPYFRCRVRPEGSVQGFAKLDGSQRPLGLIFPDTATRSVFLGTLVLGDEVAARQYGIDPDRDLAGFVERIGPARWRLILPAPRFESLTDVIELVPAS